MREAQQGLGFGVLVNTLSLVIPAYNEKERIPALLRTLETAPEVVEQAGLKLQEVLIVDDGSDDGTKQLLAEAEPTNPLLRPLLQFDQNRGKGAAVASGALEAKADYVLIADVDLSTPLTELGKLVVAIRDGADIAIGSRHVEGAEVDRGPAHRKLLGKAFNGAVRTLTGLDARDTQCGFKLLPTKLAQPLFGVQTCPGFAFDVELLLRADTVGLSIVEVPVIYLHDSRSRVQVASASWQMLKDVCGLSYRIRMRREPPVRGSEALDSPRERVGTHG
jgi:glycosyltransferase involved in cell wall biosynthesis